MADQALEAIKNTESSDDISCYDMRFIKPLDEKLLHIIFKNHPTIITIEDGVMAGGFGSAIAEFAVTHNYHNTIEMLGIPDSFPSQGSIEELQEIAGYSPNKIKEVIEIYI
jgi:1-deoxy-D-xylulose-5-phosphate synthase